jgi:hypothetical protein
MVVDEERGLLYVLCGSGNTFGSSNLDDIYELNLSTSCHQACF